MPLPEAPHALPAELVRDLLGTGPDGLSEREAETRLGQYGGNVLKEEKTSRLVIFLRQFRNILVYILIAAAAISLVVSDVKDFFIIVVIICVNSIIGYWQELKAEASLTALKKLTESKVSVVRSGEQRLIPSQDLVPGDCVIVSEGDIVTADIRLFESYALGVDEASLTGESLPVTKDHAATVAADAPPYDRKTPSSPAPPLSGDLGKGTSSGPERAPILRAWRHSRRNGRQRARSPRQSGISRNGILACSL